MECILHTLRLVPGSILTLGPRVDLLYGSTGQQAVEVPPLLTAMKTVLTWSLLH